MKIIHSLYKLSSTSMYILSHTADDNNEFDKKIHKDLILCKKGQAFPVLFQVGHLYTVVTRLVQDEPTNRT